MGNRWASADSGFPPSPFTPTVSTNFDAGNNQLQLQGSTYDSAGNQTSIGVQASTFDAEGRMTTNTLDGTTTYVYDGEGQRVMKQTSAGTTTYVYDAVGNLAAEYNTVAAASACGTPTCYVTVDQLGSTRVVTDSSGNVTQRYDYLPFGEEIPAGTDGRTTAMGYQSPGDGFNPKFTGQVRDVESGLDYFNARYYSPEQGRFVSVDPQNAGSDPTNPQTWNGYAYVGGNPMAYTDPSGQGFWSTLGLDLLQGVIDLAPAIIGLVVPEVLPLPDIFLAADTTTAMDVPAFSITTIAAPTLGMVASEVGGLSASTALSATLFPGLTFYAQGTAKPPSVPYDWSKTARCAAQFSDNHSMAAGLQSATGGAVSKDNLFVNAVFGSDASTISNLITGPRAPEVGPYATGKAITNATKAIGNLPNPFAAGLASLGKAAIKETAGGAPYAASWTDATIASSVLGRGAGRAFAWFTIGKAVWDASTYAAGVFKCY